MRTVLMACLLILSGHMLVAAGIGTFATSEKQSKVMVVNDDVDVEDEKVEPRGVIEVQIADWCSPCRKFKAAKIMDELREAGWEVRVVSGIGKYYPSFRVTIDGESRSWSGYSSKGNFYSTLKSFMRELGVAT